MGMADMRIISGADDSAIAAWIAAHLGEQRGGMAITVPGGSTPFPILKELAKAPLDWPRISVWPGDERLVDEGDPAINVGRIRQALAGSGARIVPLEEHAVPPRFALVWLGMGLDGHIASLFPSCDPQADDSAPLRRIMPDPLPPEAPYARLSLTIPALLNSDAVLFVVRGAEKRNIFEAAARGENDLPVARLLAAARQPVTCFT